jgi:hypothetical protein
MGSISDETIEADAQRLHHSADMIAAPPYQRAADVLPVAA